MGIKHEIIFKTDTLTMTKAPANTGDAGYWLYDKTRGMNLAMRAKSEQNAFTEALEYYQYRLQEVENKHESLKSKVEKFVGLFVDDENSFEVE